MTAASRYLVTGGAGFIGSNIVEHLVQRGDEVVVLDDFSTGRRENLDGLWGSITLMEGRLTEPKLCREAVDGVDYVLHQAAVPSVPRSVADPMGAHEPNATGTLTLLVAAREAGVRRVVCAGSSSAYGNTAELPKREEMKPLPLSPYAASKLAAEHYCRAFHASYGLGTVVLRYFNVFGPRQDPTSQYSAVIPKFITAAIEGERPTIYGDGEQTRDFTYVENVVRANLLACDAPEEALGRAFNIGCGERISINELWRRIKQATGAAVEPEYHERRVSDVRDSLASLEHARELLGYEPLVGLEEGIRRTADWLRRTLAAGSSAP